MTYNIALSERVLVTRVGRRMDSLGLTKSDVTALKSLRLINGFVFGGIRPPSAVAVEPFRDPEDNEFRIRLDAVVGTSSTPRRPVVSTNDVERRASKYWQPQPREDLQRRFPRACDGSWYPALLDDGFEHTRRAMDERRREQDFWRARSENRTVQHVVPASRITERVRTEWCSTLRGSPALRDGRKWR
jgi:hypothetical protein